MSKRLVILILTLAANVVLAATFVRSHRGPISAMASQETQSDVKSPAQPAAPESTDKVAAVTEMASTTAIPAFNWAELESSDYKDYIEKLRAFGVPERTIRDIIMADVAKM